MTDAEHKNWREEPHLSAAPRLVAAPSPHAGIGRALRVAFDPAAKLPDDLTSLLGRLR